MSERFGKIPGSPKSIQGPDPHLHSILPPKHIVDSKKVRDIDSDRMGAHRALGRDAPDVYELTCDDGNTYYEIGSPIDRTKDPQETIFHRGTKQLFFSRLLKGILHVSDVVLLEEADKRHFLSRKMPMSDIRTPLSKSEIRSEIEFLYLLFGDVDHELPSKNVRTERAWKDNPFKHRMMLFDIRPTTAFASPTVPEAHAATSSADKDFLIRKLGELKSRLVGHDGATFVAAIQKSIPDCNFRNTLDVANAEEFCIRTLKNIDSLIEALSRKPTKAELLEWKKKQKLDEFMHGHRPH